MGQVKLLSDKKISGHPYNDEGVWKTDLTQRRKKLNSTERKLFASQVHQFYCLKYQIPKTALPLQTMQDLWESPRSVRRLWFLGLMHKYGFRKCAF